MVRLHDYALAQGIGFRPREVPSWQRRQGLPLPRIPRGSSSRPGHVAVADDDEAGTSRRISKKFEQGFSTEKRSLVLAKDMHA